jgi:hypothetical protein
MPHNIRKALTTDAWRVFWGSDWPLILAVSVLALTLSVATSCNAPKAPPNLTPQSTAAWYGTRVIQALDVLRNTAIDAAAQRPPILSEATARKVVLLHESALKMVHESPAGWAPTVTTALTEFEKTLTEQERGVVHPYVQMTLELLKSVQS